MNHLGQLALNIESQQGRTDTEQVARVFHIRVLVHFCFAAGVSACSRHRIHEEYRQDRKTFRGSSWPPAEKDRSVTRGSWSLTAVLAET